jgi:XTP/dITP diphosphohydrolase
MHQLIFATNNNHKLEEIRNTVGKQFNILSLYDLGFVDDIPETAETLEGNASLKSNFIHQRFKKNCFADDTGLEVAALNGKPGVHSARYSGSGHDHQKNIEKLLSELQGEKNRLARFRTVISLIYDGKETIFDGIVTGRITEEKHGNKGFGYDPVFIPEGFTKSFAEMDLLEKNELSHRGKAIRKLLAYLKTVR